MNTSGRRAALALAFLITTAAACTNQAAPSTPPPSSPRPSLTAGPAATLPPPATPRPCFTRAELAAMALEEIAAHASLCFDSQDGVQTEIAQAEAIETVRAFL